MKSRPDRISVPGVEPSGAAVLAAAESSGTGSPADIEAMPLRMPQRKGERLSQVLGAIQAPRHVPHEGEDSYRHIFESMDEGCCVVEVLFDPGGRAVDYRFLAVNPAFEQQCGLRDAIGKCMRQLAPDHEAHWYETYGRVAATGEAVRFVAEAAALGGRWFDVNAFRLGGPGSRKVAVLFTDITARRQTEQALRDSEQRLLQMIDALRESDRHKDEFIALLAHELRNPLAPMRNALEVMRRATDGGPHRTGPEAMASAIDMMERQVGQVVHLVDDLLDVSRISRGKIELRRQVVELPVVIDPIVQAARSMCEAAGQRLVVTLPSEPVRLDVDPTRIAQIIGNLLNNAGKFTERGGCIALNVEVARAAPQAPSELVVRVRDTGIGIAADQVSRIFDMFTQVDASVRRSTNGLGIGLALVKSLAELHGGSVSVHSAGLGCGAEFTVRLPVVMDRAEPPESTPPADPGGGTALRVLVVDDNRDSADSLAVLLELNGHVTQTAYGGLEAVDAVASFRPEVVLLDIGLPGVDGYEAARRIRERHPDAPLLLVALTGWGQPEDRRRTAAAGFDAHIVKPVEPEALLSLLAKRLPPRG